MFLEDPRAAGDTFSEPTRGWWSAVGELAAATDEAERMVEQSIADAQASEEAMRRRHAEIHKVTGVQLQDWRRKAQERMRDVDSGRVPVGMGKREETQRRIYAEEEAAYRANLAGLAEQYPDQARLFSPDFSADVKQVMRQADERRTQAAADPSLGPGGWLLGSLIGGVTAAPADPVNWATLPLGASGKGATVATRLGSTMLTEAAVAGTTELVLQFGSQERKKAAGLVHGTADIMQNVAMAAGVGSIFGGLLQGVSEAATAFGRSVPDAPALPEETVTRVTQGRLEPQDVEAIAAATGRSVTADEAADLARAVEEDALDTHFRKSLSEALARDGARVADEAYDDVIAAAAARHALDPDEWPDPALVERQYADRLAGGEVRTLTADEYFDLYDGREAEFDIDPASDVDEPPLAGPAAVRAVEDEGVTVRGDDASGDGLEALDRALDADDDGNVDPRGLLPLDEGDGRVSLVDPRDYVESARAPARLADVLEACKI